MVAMAAIAMKIRFSAILRLGPKALLFGWTVAIVQSAFLWVVVLLCM